jgi:hypothetical protein
VTAPCGGASSASVNINIPLQAERNGYPPIMKEYSFMIPLLMGEVLVDEEESIDLVMLSVEWVIIIPTFNAIIIITVIM